MEKCNVCKNESFLHEHVIFNGEKVCECCMYKFRGKYRVLRDKKGKMYVHKKFRKKFSTFKKIEEETKKYYDMVEKFRDIDKEISVLSIKIKQLKICLWKNECRIKKTDHMKKWFVKYKDFEYTHRD